MADRAEQEAEDEYASDEYEAESPVRTAPTEEAPPTAAGPALSPLTFTDGGLEDEIDASEESAGEVATPRQTTAKRKSGRSQRRSLNTNGRHLLDNTPWVFTVWATHVRALRIPAAESGALRELRVFATLDKQAAQSRGSTWKHELPSSSRASASIAPNQRRSSIRSSTSSVPERSGKPTAVWSSGLIEEAKWLREDGKLQWTFPMERFRRLKAYSPRVKAFVYGIREDAVVAEHTRPLAEDLARQEKEESIVSFGWFFLDLRTPDLPERWMKLSNSPFGGEVQLSTTFSPVESAMTAPSPSMSDQIKGKLDTPRLTEQTVAQGSNIVAQTMAVVTAEDGECLRIGDSNGTDVFVISVFVRSAMNLTGLVQAAMGTTHLDESHSSGFWLSYSLFGVVVQTDVFYNLGVAEFPSIRDSFRVQSCLGDLHHFLEESERLSVFLCTENRVLAGVDIRLKDLLSGELFSSLPMSSTSPKEGERATVEGTFPFSGFNDAIVAASVAVECVRSQKSIPETNEYDDRVEAKTPRSEHADAEAEMRGQVGAQTEDSEPREADTGERVKFRLGNIRLSNSMLTPFAGQEGVSVELMIGDARVKRDVTFDTFLKNEALGSNPEIEVVLENLPRESIASTSIRIRCVSSPSGHLLAVSSDSSTIVESEEGVPVSIALPLVSQTNTRVGECVLRCAYGLEALRADPLLDMLADTSGGTHIYRVFIHLKSVQDLAVPAGRYSLAFQDPFSGSASIDSELFDVQRKGEVPIPDFYCTFERVKSPMQLKKEMEAALAIALISRDGNSQTSVVGSAAFSLNSLFFSEEQFCCTDPFCREVFQTEAVAETHWMEVHTASTPPANRLGSAAHAHSYRSCSISIPVVGAGGATSSSKPLLRLGLIRVVAHLEDLGPAKQSNADATTNSVRCIPLMVSHAPAYAQKEVSPVRSTASPRIDPLVNPRSQSSGNSLVREPEKATHSSSYENVGSALLTTPHLPDSEQTKTKAKELREKLNEIDELKQSLQREKDTWEQEQQLQQLQWKRRFAEMEKARMDELEEEWARREEERSALLRSAQGEYQGLEQTLRNSLADLEARERRITVAEAALQREQRNQREENELLQKRLKSEQSHALSLAKKQTEVYERRIAMLEKQLGDAEKRAKQVEEDFAEYRQQQRKVPESRLREQIAALTGNVAELEKQKMAQERACEVAESNIEKLKAQLEKMAKLVLEEKKKHENQAVEELEKLRIKYIAREEKYVLDGDRDELRAIKKQLDDLRGFSVRGLASDGSTYERRHARRSTSSRPRRSGRTAPSEQTGRIRPIPPQSRDRSSFSSDQESLSGRSLWQEDEYSVVEAGNGEMVTPRDHDKAHRDGRDSPGSGGSREDDHRSDSRSMNASDDEAETQTAPIHNLGLPGGELARLVRERKLLLASGAYDTQSYLVRELDRLIRITRARAQQQSPEG